MAGKTYGRTTLQGSDYPDARGVVTGFDWEVCDVEFPAQLRDAEIVGVESADQPRTDINEFLDSSVDNLDLSVSC